MLERVQRSFTRCKYERNALIYDDHIELLVISFLIQKMNAASGMIFVYKQFCIFLDLNSEFIIVRLSNSITHGSQVNILCSEQPLSL